MLGLKLNHVSKRGPRAAIVAAHLQKLCSSLSCAPENSRMRPSSHSLRVCCPTWNKCRRDSLLIEASVNIAGITWWNKQRVLMHGHQGWNVRHGLCHIYMIYVYIWVVHSFCLFCCLFIIVTTQFVALYEPCKPKPKPSTYDTRATTPWQRSKFRYLDRSQSNKYAINMQIQTISVSK